MSEMVLNGTSMYDEVEEVKNLNRVNGFDPRKYMRLISKEGQPGKLYLDVAYRKLWFRLCFPEGKIVKKLIKLTDNVAIVEARVYLNRNDAEDNFISNALAQKYQSADEQFGNKYVELAETAAVGRALSDAGFGLQFADKEEDFDLEVTEAPIDEAIMNGESLLPAGTYMEETEGGIPMAQEPEEVPFDNAPIPGQFEIGAYIPTPAQVGAALQQIPAPAAAKEIRKDMPVEEIMQLLTRETAAAVVVSVGFNKGKTMGQVALEKPENLEWYVNSYGGPDNLLRASAKYLIEKAYVKE